MVVSLPIFKKMDGKSHYIQVQIPPPPPPPPQTTGSAAVRS